MARLNGPSLLHTKDEERLFSTLNQISRETSSRSLDSIRDNSIIRLQFEQMYKDSNNSSYGNLESKITKITNSNIEELKDQNSIFNLDEIPHMEFQTHLERIGDYLIYGEGVWWQYNQRRNEVVFLDATNQLEIHDEGPEMFDFTQTTVSNLNKEVKNTWNFIVENSIKVPLPNLIIYDNNGDYVSQKKCLDIEYVEEECHEVDFIALPEETQEKNHVDKSNDMVPGTSCTLKVNTCSKANNNQIGHCNLKSSIAKNISRVVGYSELIAEFDKHHIAYKNSGSQISRQFCRNVLPKIQVLVLKTYQQKNSKVTDWEKTFYDKHGYEPNQDDISNVEILYNQVYTANKLLQSWNIQLF